MAELETTGYWRPDYWPGGYWAPDYWAGGGAGAPVGGGDDGPVYMVIPGRGGRRARILVQQEDEELIILAG